LCETLTSAGKVDRALDEGAKLITQLESGAGPSQKLCEVHLRLARSAATACAWDVAEAHLARASALTGPDQTFTARSEAIRSHIFLGRGESERATEAALAALAASEPAGLHEVACEALEVVGRAARLTDIDAAEAAFLRGHKIAADHGLTLWRVRAPSEP